MPRPGHGRAACAKPSVCAEQKARGRLTGSGPSTGIAKVFSRALPLRLPKSFADITDGPTWAVADGVFSWLRRANGSGVPGAVLCRVGLRAAGFRLASVAGVILTLLTVLPAQAEDPPSWPVVSTEPGQVLYVPSGSFGTATAAAALHGNVTIIYDDPDSDEPYVAVPVNEPWVPGPSYGVMNWITRGGATIYVPSGSTIQAGSNYAGAFIDAQTEHPSFIGNPTKFINDGIISFYDDNVEILALHGFDFRNNGMIEIGNIILQNVDDPSGDVLFRNTGSILVDYIFLFNMGVGSGPTGTTPYEGDIVLHNLGTGSVIESEDFLLDVEGSGRIEIVNQGTIRSLPDTGIYINSSNDSNVAWGSLNDLRPFQEITVRNEGLIEAADPLEVELRSDDFEYVGYGAAGDLSRLLMPAGTGLYNGPGAVGTATENTRAQIIATGGIAVTWAVGGTITNHGDILADSDAALLVDQWATVTEVELGSHPYCSSILDNCLRWIEVVNPLTVLNGPDGVIYGGDAGIITSFRYFSGSGGADEAFFYSGTSGPLLTINNAGLIGSGGTTIDTTIETRVVNEGRIESGGLAIWLSDYNDTLINTGTVEGGVRLGAGDDYLDNRGTITGAIELGSGNDGFVWWLNGSTAAGPVDAGSGTDSLLFGVDADTAVTLTSLADPQIPVGAPVGFEGIGKAGAGALTLDFDGDIETGAFDMAGGTLVLKDRLVVSAIPGLDGSGRVNFRDETGLGALFVSEQGIVADSFRMSGGGITFRNLGTLTIASGTIAADDGSQRIENSGTIALFLDFDGALDGPGDVLVNDGVISVSSGRAVYMERGSFTNTGRIETDRANFEAVVINGVMNAPSLNTGTIRADGNAVEIIDLGGNTFTNRGTLETTTDWAGVAVFGGSGTIVNGRADDATAALMRGGQGGGAAIYAEGMSDLRIENQGLMEGTYTISAYRNAMTTIINSGQITADADAGGSDAINLGDGNVLVQNLAGGVISANGDAFWIENRVAAYETRIENAAGAFIIGDNSATDTVTYGRAINVFDDVTAGGVTTFVPSREIVSNAGTIRGDISLASGSDRLTLFETGVIEGAVDLGAGDDLLELYLQADGQAGGTISGLASGGAGIDTVVFSIAEGSRRLLALPTVLTSLDQFEGIGKGGAGTLVFDTPLLGDDRPGRLEVLDGTLVLTQSVEVVTTNTGWGGATLFGDVILHTPESAKTTRLQVGEDGQSTARLVAAGAVSMAAGSEIDVRAGAELRAAEIAGDNGTQTVFNAGLIVAPVRLGGGTDRVVNRFGTYLGGINLGAGDDVLEVYLDALTQEVGGLIDGTPDGGDGYDTVVYSLEEGRLELRRLPAMNPGTLLGFEGIGKGGNGDLVFLFDSPVDTGTMWISGPGVLATEMRITIGQGDGKLRLIENTGGAETSVRVTRALTAEGGVLMQGATELEIAVASNIGPGLAGDAGAQRLVLTDEVAGTAVDLAGGNDELRITATGRFSGSASGGAGVGDALLVDHAAGSPALTIGATTFSGFETVNLNAAGTTGIFQLAGDTSVSPDAATGVLFQSETGTSEVLLHHGRMVGNGAIGGDLSVMAGAGGGAGAVIAPGNSIGRIKVKDYVQTGVYEAEFRVPDAALFQRRGGALVGRNPVDMPGLVLADQDADLVWASGSANITGGFLISQFGSTSTIAAAMAAPDNTTGQVRYLLATAPVLTGLPVSGYLVLGDPDGNPATTERIVMTDRDVDGTADSVELVFQAAPGGGGGGTGGGGGGGTGGGGDSGGDGGGDGGVFPAVVAPTLPESFQLRPERVTGCLDRAIVAWGPGGASQGRCLWASVEGLAGGEADLGGTLREDLDELQLDFGAETRLSTGAEDTDARLGVLLGYRKSESTLSTGSSASADTLRLGLYAELTSGPVEGSASLIWGISDISTQRTGVAGKLLSGETDGQSLSFDIAAQRWIATRQPDLTWAPYAGLSYTSASRDGFTETGDRLEAFSYDDAEGHGLWARLGLRARYDVAAAPGRTPARVEGGIGIETLLSGDGLGVAGAFGPYTIPGSPGASRFDDTALLLDLSYDAVLSTRGQRVTEFSAALGLRSTGSATDASLELQLRTSW